MQLPCAETRLTGEFGMRIAPGPVMVERAILTALVVLSVLTVMTRVGGNLSNQLQKAGQHEQGPAIVPVDAPDSVTY